MSTNSRPNTRSSASQSSWPSTYSLKSWVSQMSLLYTMMGCREFSGNSGARTSPDLFKVLLQHENTVITYYDRYWQILYKLHLNLCYNFYEENCKFICLCKQQALETHFRSFSFSLNYQLPKFISRNLFKIEI